MKDRKYIESVNHLLRCLIPTKEEREERLSLIETARGELKKEKLELILYGSVAYGTFLPDGDIDLTVFSTKSDTSWKKRVLKVLTHGPFSKFVDEAEYINAKVKIFKITCKNIPIDLSCNQLNGVKSKCFLEYLNLKFQKHHLLKKSILLLKAWCTLEAHCLASSHGMLSSYALSVLIIYIINLNYDKVSHPFDVLDLFLSTYSEFDFQKYGITIFGKMNLNMLSIEDGKPFLSKKEMKEACRSQINLKMKPFIQRSINIFDPIQDFNNLGQSVSRGSYQRIKQCIILAAESMKRIKKENRSIQKLFPNTLHTYQKRGTSHLNLIFWKKQDKIVQYKEPALFWNEQQSPIRNPSTPIRIEKGKYNDTTMAKAQVLSYLPQVVPPQLIMNQPQPFSEWQESIPNKERSKRWNSRH